MVVHPLRWAVDSSSSRAHVPGVVGDCPEPVAGSGKHTRLLSRSGACDRAAADRVFSIVDSVRRRLVYRHPGSVSRGRKETRAPSYPIQVLDAQVSRRRVGVARAVERILSPTLS